MIPEGYKVIPQSDVKKVNDTITELRQENAKLNLILFHKENGLGHPDEDIKVGILQSKLASQQKLIEQLVEAVENGFDYLNKPYSSKYGNVEIIDQFSKALAAAKKGEQK
jgi:hypothetical protein